jgi:uncharacterized protein (TIGR02453 family)
MLFVGTLVLILLVFTGKSEMSQKFTTKTFEYFKLAEKNKHKKDWFEKNKSIYIENVREPFSSLILEINKSLSKDLLRIEVNPKSITRPTWSSAQAHDKGFVKNTSYVTLWEKRTSLFEWNPGVHIQLGLTKEDCILACGLYMVSSRQMSLMRHHTFKDFEEFDAIVSNKKFKSTWGALLGDKFKRFPKGYDPDDERTKYIWHKQFYVGQTLTRSEIVSKNFYSRVIKDLKLAMPFLDWIRKTVGTY